MNDFERKKYETGITVKKVSGDIALHASKMRNSLLLICLYFSILFFAFLLFTKVASCQTYNAVDWGTYFNDNAHFPDFNYQLDDDVDDIAVSKTSPESIYIVGQSAAATIASLPVCSGNQSIALHSVNGFLAKYNSCGELIWSTYIGSTAFCVALDIENGKTIIYVGGKSNSGSAFSCDGSAAPVFQTNAIQSTNAFIAKYEDDDSTVSLLRWTFLSGSTIDPVPGIDAIHSIAVYHHHIFFCGDTFSGNIYLGAQYKGDTIYNGLGDGYMAEFDSLLSSLIFFTYIGGHDWDRSHDIKIFQSGQNPINIFVGGSTLSDDGIAMGTGFDLTYNGDNDTYLSKWQGTNVNGLFTEKWCTYIGGSGMEHGRRIALDGKGNAFFTGYTGSTDFPVTSLAYDTLFGGTGNGGLDAFVIKVSSTGQKLWCTYFGGASKEEMGRSLVLFKKNGIQYVIVAGLTKSLSNNFPLVSPVQSLVNGNDTQDFYDEFIAILTDATSTQQQLVYSTYLGGSKEEHIGAGQYHPIIDLGPNKELYITSASKSSDIQQVVGSDFQNIVHGYNGGSDVFTAKLININNHHQFNCPLLKYSNSGNDEFNQLHIFPNPVQQIFTAEINSESDENSLIEIVDAYGKTILKEEILIRSGVNQIPIDLKNAPSGIYIIRITDNEKVIFSSLIKQ